MNDLNYSTDVFIEALDNYKAAHPKDPTGYMRFKYATDNVTSSSQKVHTDLSAVKQKRQTQIFARNLDYIHSIDSKCARGIISKVEEFYKQPQKRYPLRCILQKYHETAIKPAAKPSSVITIT